MKLVMSYRMDRLGNSLLETVLIKLGFHSATLLSLKGHSFPVVYWVFFLLLYFRRKRSPGSTSTGDGDSLFRLCSLSSSSMYALIARFNSSVRASIFFTSATLSPLTSLEICNSQNST